MKIFLFGLRRSGTTFAFSLFRRCEELRCYYEPLHPNLVSADGASCLDADSKGAYTEFSLIRDELPHRHAGFGAPKYDVLEEMVENNLTSRHFAYLDFLLGSSENVLLQPVRLNYQLYQLAERYPDARFVWVLRRPEGFIKSVLAYRPAMLDYRDAGIPGNHAMNSCRKNFAFRLMRGWRAFDNPWSQVAAANFIISARPCFRGLADSPTWIKLLALWYDHYLFVSKFLASNVAASQVFLYEQACHSNDYIRQQMRQLGLAHAGDAFDGLTDAAVLRRQDESRLDIAAGEKLILQKLRDCGLDPDLSLRESMG